MRTMEIGLLEERKSVLGAATPDQLLRLVDEVRIVHLCRCRLLRGALGDASHLHRQDKYQADQQLRPADLS